MENVFFLIWAVINFFFAFLGVVQVPFSTLSSHIPGAYRDANTHRTYRRTEGLDPVGTLCLEGGVMMFDV